MERQVLHLFRMIRRYCSSYMIILSILKGYHKLFGIIWSIPFGEEEIQGDLARARMNFNDYNGFETYIPVWYK